MADVAATDEPEIAPKNIFASTFVAARYPGIQPTKSLASRTSLFAIPPLFIIFPANVKNGNANNENESIPEKLLCAAINDKTPIPGFGSKLAKAVAMEAIPIPTEIGTPANNITKNTPKSIKTDCITTYLPAFLSLKY